MSVFLLAKLQINTRKNPRQSHKAIAEGESLDLGWEFFVLWGLFLPLESDVATYFADGVGMLVFISAMKWFALVRLLTREETEAALLL